MMSDKEEYQDLWHIIRVILILSHGQASVERNFSISDDMLLPNQTPCVPSKL